MPSFSDSIFLFILALLLFGPKKLPVLARQLGKWMAEFRRASNEFKMQMEEELRLSEQADRQAKVAAIEAAAAPTPAIEGGETPADSSTTAEGETNINTDPEDPHPRYALTPAETAEPVERVDGVRPIPIAVSGDLKIMPPSTGLPVAQSTSEASALDPLLASIPTAEPSAEETTENAAHGD